MNSRERIRTLLSGKAADRMGLQESMWPETIPAWLGQGYPRQSDDPESPAKSPHEVFGYDLWSAGPFFGFDSSPRRGFSVVVGEDEDTRLVKNAFGAVQRLWKKKSGTPEHVSFEMDNRAYWDNIKGPLLELDRGRVGDVKGGREQIERMHAEGKYLTIPMSFVFEQMRGSMGDFTMMMAFLQDPDWVRDFCRVYTDFYITHFRYYFENAAKPDALFVFDDMAYTNGLWASPDSMKDLVMPFHKELVDFAHSNGVQMILHTCGDIRKGMDLIIEAGYDCVQPLEAKVGNNVVEYAEKYGNKIAYMGNINIMTLETGDRALIRKEIETKLKALRDMKIPYIFHSDHSIPPTVTLESYRYALQIYRELAEY